MNSQPNRLIEASSPYLLQHAYNPVNWFEWGPEALQKAQDENKLILVSIGYSACHWCHVMERESFELTEVAEVMNAHFVCIKVDREERPDIDQIYMMAIQLMTGSGGWPLNCICLPDQRPIYGGTYFGKDDWINVLLSVSNLWSQEPEKAFQYADRLTDGIQKSEKFVPNELLKDFDREDLVNIITPWKRHFDMVEGGYSKAPKFPLPNNWQFMLRFSKLMADDVTHVSVMHTLEKMAMGGIYDHIGGGFARYSVDGQWHVPHFEKMLYDNAQMLSLYAEAYQYSRAPRFKEVADEIIAWLQREMMSEQGLFYSALDADSEGVEGKFYVWDKQEFDEVLGDDASLLHDYFDVTKDGNWEEEQTNILRTKYAEEEYAQVKGITVLELQEKILEAKKKLLLRRTDRIRPGLDDKCLTAWNAMTIRGLINCAQVFENDHYYQLATKAAKFILSDLKTTEGSVYRNFKSGNKSIPGFLDDYAFLIDALIGLYEFDFNERWLDEAKELTTYVLSNFADDDSPMLYYTSQEGETLIARKHEIMDNVIPASNSIMAQNLQKLGLMYDVREFSERASAMLASVHPQISNYGSAYSNWCILLLYEVFGINEIAIIGEEPEKTRREFNHNYIPNKPFLAGTNSELPLLKDKQSFETKIYICRNKVCQLPVSTVEEALLLITK
ncbi:MAG: thioredoxin domain-containing protein [Pedobacter sp.]